MYNRVRPFRTSRLTNRVSANHYDPNGSCSIGGDAFIGIERPSQLFTKGLPNMPRQPRLDYPGAFHHVMNRGAARQSTFKDNSDNKLFVSLLADAVSRFRIQVIGYCLMGNHFHLLVQSPEAQLSATMQFIGRAYTQAFNARHGRDGALFRGRFHSVLVDTDTYFARVVRYIDLNPISAGICQADELRTYPWSSHRFYAGYQAPPAWLATHHIHSWFSCPSDYERFVLASVVDNELADFYGKPLRSGRVLGSQQFVDTISHRHPQLGSSMITGIPDTDSVQIDRLVYEVSGRDPRAPAARGHLYPPSRAVAIDLSYCLTDERLSDLAHRYGFSSRSAFQAAAGRAAKQNFIVKENRQLRQSVIERLDHPAIRRTTGSDPKVVASDD